MNIEAMKEHLAGVLGITQGETEYQWNFQDGSSRYLDGRLFDPFTNIEQAMAVLARSREWEKTINAGTDDGSSSVSALFDKWGWAQMDNEDEFCKAAMTACCRATGYEDET